MITPTPSAATPAKKTARARSAAQKSIKAPTEDRTHAAWLVRDDKLLVASLASDIYTIATSLQRTPLSVLQRLVEPRVLDALEKQGLSFEFDHGSEEQSELYGLALSGVPLVNILQWCLAKDERPTTAQLDTMMTSPDFRPALYMARELGITFSNVDQMEDLRALEQDWPQEIVQAGVEDVIARFDIPTAAAVLSVLEGDPQEKAKPYPWFDKDAPIKMTGKGSKRPYRRKSRSSYSRSTTWKPYRKSRRSYGAKRTYA